MHLRASRPARMALRLRIPGWASQAGPLIHINGERYPVSIKNGFAGLKRTWKDGDRIEVELPMPLRLEAVDANHPDLVALLQGPVVLMAVAEMQPTFDAQSLLRAKPLKNAVGDWSATSTDGIRVTMRPFMSIDKESYCTYVRIKI